MSFIHNKSVRLDPADWKEVMAGIEARLDKKEIDIKPENNFHVLAILIALHEGMSLDRLVERQSDGGAVIHHFSFTAGEGGKES